MSNIDSILFVQLRFLLFPTSDTDRLGVLWKGNFTELFPCKNGKNHKYVKPTKFKYSGFLTKMIPFCKGALTNVNRSEKYPQLLFTLL